MTITRTPLPPASPLDPPILYISVSGGESLTYEVDVVQGAQAAFFLVEPALVLMSPTTGHGGPNTFQRIWPMPGDSWTPGVAVTHSLLLFFATVIEYELRVFKLTGATQTLLKHVRYRSDALTTEPHPDGWTVIPS